jgi:hypothetical protein
MFGRAFAEGAAVAGNRAVGIDATSGGLRPEGVARLGFATAEDTGSRMVKAAPAAGAAVGGPATGRDTRLGSATTETTNSGRTAGALSPPPTRNPAHPGNRAAVTTNPSDGPTTGRVANLGSTTAKATTRSRTAMPDPPPAQTPPGNRAAGSTTGNTALPVHPGAGDAPVAGSAAALRGPVGGRAAEGAPCP